MSIVRLPNPKGLEFVYHGDHLEVIRTDGKTPTLKDMKVRDIWFEYLKNKAETMRHCPVSSINEGFMIDKQGGVFLKENSYETTTE